LVHFWHKCLLEEFHNQWINAVDQKATSAYLGGMVPLPLDPPWKVSGNMGDQRSPLALEWWQWYDSWAYFKKSISIYILWMKIADADVSAI